jgi:hypothetical protein
MDGRGEVHWDRKSGDISWRATETPWGTEISVEVSAAMTDRLFRNPETGAAEFGQILAEGGRRFRKANARKMPLALRDASTQGEDEQPATPAEVAPSPLARAVRAHLEGKSDGDR